MATLAFVAAGASYQLFLIRALQGLGVALPIPASMVLMAAASEKRSRGGTMGIHTTCRMIGIAVGPVLGGVLCLAGAWAVWWWVSEILEEAALVGD